MERAWLRRTIKDVDPTTQAFLAALIGAIVAGGAVLAWHISERQQHPPLAAHASPLPDGVASVLSVLRSSAVVVDSDDDILKASAPAYAMGLVSDGRLASVELAELITQVRRDGEIVEAELVMARRGTVPRHVTARVAPLSSRLVLALVEDRTREHRVESVRRDFVANVSHELKTPLGAIKLLAEAVADAVDDPEAIARFAGRMSTEADRLSELVQQIIELSRLQDDDPLEEPAVLSLDEVVAAAVDASTIDAADRKIAVTTTGTPGLRVWGNDEQVRAAIANLVANAVAYSDAGSTVVVSAKTDRDMVEVSVVDQGVGIPTADLDRIFERFYRVDPARHRSTGGTGLGLSIVKHVAATHGGEVRVWSVEGQGSTFTLTLPQAHQEEAR